VAEITAKSAASTTAAPATNSGSVWAARESVKAVPVITTTHPAGPLIGENDEMVGEAADAGASSPSTTRARHGGHRRYAQSQVSFG
jgi:hypothetical protein